jgi:hypothetical protein
MIPNRVTRNVISSSSTYWTEMLESRFTKCAAKRLFLCEAEATARTAWDETFNGAARLATGDIQ